MKTITLAAALFIALGISPVQAQTKHFGNTVRIATVPGIELSRIQRESYRSYRSKKAYFGAFYVVEGTDHGFWTRQFHNFDVAKAAAKKGCEIISKGGNCKLYALTYPDGVNPNAQGVKGFSHQSGKTFTTRYKRDQKKGKYGAFAVSKANGYGHSFGWKSAKEARAAAIEYCKLSSNKTLAPLGIEARKWARARGMEKCTVVDTHTPD